MTNFIDLNVLNFFVSISNKGFHILDSIMIFFTVLGDDGHIFIATSIILLIFKKTRSLGILLAISLLLTLAVSSILKHEVHRLRPYEVFTNIKLLVDKPSSSSFPSGHASAAFNAFGVFWFTKNKYRYFVFLVSFLILLSRLYLNVHFFSDVLIGGLIGLFISWTIIKIHGRISKQNINKGGIKWKNTWLMPF